MKILFLQDSLNLGGTEVLALDLCRNARLNGLDLTLVATGGGDLEEEFRASGAKFLSLPRRFAIDPYVVWRLRRFIHEQNVQIVHANQAVEGVHAYLAAAKTSAKVVLSHHGFIHDRKNEMALKFLIPRVAKNIYVGEGLREWYSETAGLDSAINHAVVFNGIDETRLSFSGDNLKIELGLAQDDFLFGMVANFYAAPRKDQMTLCRAFATIAAMHPNCHLVLVGKIETGAEQKYAEIVDFCKSNNIAGRVHFLGQRSDIPKILHSLDVFVLSSIHEGLAIAVIEAMLTNTPCIVSDIKPLMEVSNNGEFALTFETQNPGDLADKMLLSIRNAEVSNDLAKRAYAFAKEQFSIESHIKNLKSVYESIV